MGKTGTYFMQRNGSLPVGLTLVEMLIVIVLLSLVAGSMITGLSSFHNAAKLEQLVQQIRQLDRAARLLARIENTARIDVGQLALELVEPRSGEMMRRLAIPEGTQVYADRDNDEPLKAIHYNGAGRSTDVIVVLQVDDRQQMLVIHGLTGTVEVLPREEEMR